MENDKDAVTILTNYLTTVHQHILSLDEQVRKLWTVVLSLSIALVVNAVYVGSKVWH